MARIAKKERLPALYQAILTLKTEEDCRHFFEDLCTVTELSAMEQRYAVAELLLQDKVYLDILGRTNASTSTISRVKRVITDGNGALVDAIGKLAKEQENAEEQS